MSSGLHQAIDIPFTHIAGVRVTLPPVNVVLCNYNQGRFVRDAILSVAQQAYANFECVIVDDRSTDGSQDIIRETLRELGDARFRFIAREQNGGQMAAMLTGLDAGEAPFVSFLDADDVWLPSFLETHVACHLNPACNAALSSINLATIGADGTLIAGSNPAFSHSTPTRDSHWFAAIPIPNIRREVADRTDIASATVFVRNGFQSWIWSPTSGLMFRRAVLEAIRPKNTDDFRSCADLYLARFAHLIGGSILAHGVHGYYRIHGSNMFAKNAVFGDGVHLGTVPKSVGEMTRRTMIEKLCSDEIFPVIIPEQHLANTLASLAKTQDEIALVLKSGYLKSGMSKKLRKKFRRRAARAYLRSLFGLKASKT